MDTWEVVQHYIAKIKQDPLFGTNLFSEWASEHKADGSVVGRCASGLEVCRDNILFNGAPIEDVVSYNEELGEVHYYEHDWRSKERIPDGDDPTGYRTGRSRGKVEVVSKYVPPTPVYTSDPNNTGSIDPNYAPWYPYGNPGLSTTKI